MGGEARVEEEGWVAGDLVMEEEEGWVERGWVEEGEGREGEGGWEAGGAGKGEDWEGPGGAREQVGGLAGARGREEGTVD